jgi:hypothetical protein
LVPKKVTAPIVLVQLMIFHAPVSETRRAVRMSAAAVGLAAAMRHLNDRVAGQAFEAIEDRQALVRFARLHGDPAERTVAEGHGGILGHGRLIKGGAAAGDMIQINARRDSTGTRQVAGL